jgi:hypothetical protein
MIGAIHMFPERLLNFLRSLRLPATFLVGCLAVSCNSSRQDGPLKIEIRHRKATESKCEDYGNGKTCLDEKHWVIKARGRACNIKELNAILEEEADTDRTNMKIPYLSNREILICAESSSPWGITRSITNLCTPMRVCIYKFKLLTADSKEKESAVEARFPIDRSPCLPFETFEVLIRNNPDYTVSYQIGGRDPVGNAREMVDTIASKVPDIKKSHKMAWVIVDVKPDVSFGVVARFFDLCHKKDLFVEMNFSTTPEKKTDK